MKQPWDPNLPFESVIDQLEEAQDYAEAGNQPFTDVQILNTAYTLVYKTSLFFDDIKRWNAKPVGDKTFDNFKAHMMEAQLQLRLQQQTAQQSGFGSANFLSGMYCQPAEHQENPNPFEAMINMANAATNDNRKALGKLTNTMELMQAKVAEKDTRINDLLQAMQLSLSNTNDKRTKKSPRTDQGSYCHTHGYLCHKLHNSANCCFPKPGQIKEAIRTDNMGGNQEGKPVDVDSQQ
uniref:Uncharacterized protein n=1 Tax=Entomoneis paludosa TaxID=265537 RepID=A0A6U3E495_9STRA|mmetsp:Transcript_5696/g.12023  ORF Transcript_5696/g.12023 Transcript_5696/m.12023 type:complete len:236 (+) Transcript_5696:1827-2534(+)